ncbi:hypothetical protein EDC96DRAFT_608889 [Choanephora cucurbitarum]|nr:hypothetical protein EDC96DRAFT_608889 [Choanephora cucurbitarum]
MTDNVCFSLLKTATQQIIQSAGFEAANSRSIDALADVFGRYIELLGCTASAYANLNGRTMSNSRDVMEALTEVAIDPDNLKIWLEEEGKSLSPCWSAQSDPGRLLQDVVSGGMPHYEDMMEYMFGHVQPFELPSDEPLPDSPSESKQHDLPDYIPGYFPPFPETKDDTVMEEAELLEKQQKEQQELQLQLQKKKKDLPLPVIVKHRKKPIENPFTHIIPFDESNLASAEKSEIEDEKPLSLSFDHTAPKRLTEHDQEEHIRLLKRYKTTVEPLKRALGQLEVPHYKLAEGLKPHEKEALFRAQTQDAATPGSYMFNKDNGVFDEIVLRMAEPLISSKLTAPNLSFDVAIANPSTTAPATPSTSAPHPMLDYIPGSPDSKLMSRSMLAALAGVSKKGKPFGKLGKSMSSHTISKHSVDINAIKTGESKYLMKKKRMLAEQQAMEERQRMLEQQLKENPHLTMAELEALHPPVNSLPMAPPPSTSDNISQSSKSIPNSTIHTTTTITNTPLSSSTPSSSLPAPPSSGPISLSSLSLSTPSHHEKKPKKPTPKLTLNFPQTSSSTLDDSNTSSPSTPKIRFKIKPPNQTTESSATANTTITHTSPAKIVKPPTPAKPTESPISYQKPSLLPPHNTGGYSEEIRCICENPTVDYGTFMIACDRCSVWFHGSCVGIAESDQVEEWYCKRCRRSM